MRNVNKLIYVKLMKYNKDNIFAKILKSEIPCNKIYEDEFILSFHDICILKMGIIS